MPAPSAHTARPQSRHWYLSSLLLALQGLIQISIGLYFIFFRPPMLSEDIRYAGASLEQFLVIGNGLRLWLQKVFWVLGGHIVATGILSTYLALTLFNRKSTGAWVTACLAGTASIGWMSVVNFILASDFRWSLLALAMLWAAALVTFWLEIRHAEAIAGKP